MDLKTRSLVAGIYGYSTLHIAAWYVYLSTVQTEAWLGVFSVLFFALFLPLNVIAGIVCRVIWGTLDLFHAKYVVGPAVDGAVASLLGATALAVPVILSRRARPGRSSHVKGHGPK